MPDKRLAERLDALGAPHSNARPPAALRAAVRSAHRHRLTSTSLLASLLLASGFLAVVALRSTTGDPLVEHGELAIHRSSPGIRQQSIAALRRLDPFSDAEFPTQRTVPGVKFRPVRLLPMTAERMDRFLQGEL